MNSYSRSDQKLQGVILTEDLGSKGQNQFRGDYRTQPRHAKHLVDISNRSYLVGRAYNEPIFGDHVENLLLQRDYIID